MTRSVELDPDACYRAPAGRDARWDGRSYLGVVTTGVHCRPSCPARKPLRRNCRSYPTAAVAVAAGFRARAVRMIHDGVVDEVGVAGLAIRLAVSELRVLAERARTWRLWRGYALLHLWTQELFA